MPINYFISYSHDDYGLVEPIVNIIKLNKSFVFVDRTSIEHGKPWRDEIYKGILKADKFLVFWCCHSQISDEVMNECVIATNEGKIIIPILIDSTPLPDLLKKYHGIDFRRVIRVHEFQPTLPYIVRPEVFQLIPWIKYFTRQGSKMLSEFILDMKIRLKVGRSPKTERYPPFMTAGDPNWDIYDDKIAKFIIRRRAKFLERELNKNSFWY